MKVNVEISGGVINPSSVDANASVDVSIDEDPKIEKVRNMTFREYIKGHRCDTIFLSVITLGGWLIVEYILYRYRVEDYITMRDRERKDFTDALNRHKYDGHFDSKGNLVITRKA